MVLLRRLRKTCLFWVVWAGDLLSHTQPWDACVVVAVEAGLYCCSCCLLLSLCLPLSALLLVVRLLLLLLPVLFEYVAIALNSIADRIPIKFV